MLTILQDVPTLVNAYANWLAHPDLDGFRPCDCGHPFRHRHGTYLRWVLVPTGVATSLAILRFKCPRCRKTEAILPDFLRPRHQYPWPVQQALVEQYVSTAGSYRQVAAYQPGLPHQRLWHWVQAAATGAADLARRMVTELTEWLPGSPLRAQALADGRREPLPRRKARSAAKQEALGWVRPLLRQALRFAESFRQAPAGLLHPT